MMLSRVDIHSTCGTVPVRPRDGWLLGAQWGGWLFDDTVLPFGLISAPGFVMAVVDAVEWVAWYRGLRRGGCRGVVCVVSCGLRRLFSLSG